MAKDAADRLREKLEEKRAHIDSETERRAAEEKKEKARLEDLAQRMASVVHPVLSEAKEIFKESGFSLTSEEEQLQVRTHNAIPQIRVRLDRAWLTFSVDSRTDEVNCSFSKRGGGLPADEHIPIGQLTPEIVWSYVEKLGDSIT